MESVAWSWIMLHILIASMIPQKKKDADGNVPPRTGPFQEGDKVLCLWVGKKSIPLEYYGCTVCRYPPHPILFLHFIFDFNGTKSWLCKS